MENHIKEPIEQEKQLTSLQKWRLKNPDYNKKYYETVTRPKLFEEGKLNLGSKPKKTENMREYKNKYNVEYYNNKVRYKCVCPKCGTIISTPKYLERHTQSAKCEILSLKNSNSDSIVS